MKKIPIEIKVAIIFGLFALLILAITEIFIHGIFLRCNLSENSIICLIPFIAFWLFSAPAYLITPSSLYLPAYVAIILNTILYLILGYGIGWLIKGIYLIFRKK